VSNEPEEHKEDEFQDKEPPFPELPGDFETFHSERGEEEARRDFETFDSERSEEEARSRQDVAEKEVNVVGVYEHHKEGSSRPDAFVRLRDREGRSVLIWIGYNEAWAIAVTLEGAVVENARPLTVDLLKNILDRLGGRVERILIDDLWNDTYYAKISITLDGKSIEVDSRPSDAIALGLRAKAPIYMAESVLEQAAMYEEL